MPLSHQLISKSRDRVITTMGAVEAEEKEYVWDREIEVPARLIEYVDEGVRERRQLPGVDFVSAFSDG